MPRKLRCMLSGAVHAGECVRVRVPTMRDKRENFESRPLRLLPPHVLVFHRAFTGAPAEAGESGAVVTEGGGASFFSTSSRHGAEQEQHEQSARRSTHATASGGGLGGV